MKIEEIITNPPRDEYLDQHRYTLNNATLVATIKGLELRKAASPTEINYGLFDQHENLVGYLGLEYANAIRWQVTLVQLAQAYKGLGLGTFLYDYAVMNDKLTIISDGTNTGGPHGSAAMWERIWKNNRYTVQGIDLDTGEIFEPVLSRIYNNQFNTRWIATPGNKTINESITEIQQTLKKRWVVWYGPGTTTDTYFNW